MCGIVGHLSLSGAPPSESAVVALLPILRHRGPDGSGTATHGAAAFGHTRLSIVGPSEPAACQPVVTDGAMLSFNGEIYNFYELVAKLGAEGIYTTGRSDTEALFTALVNWGIEKTLATIDGMFGFAFYDAKEHTLFLARDRIGEKPVYWGEGNGRFWFASEIKAIVASGDVSPDPNLGRIDEFLHNAKVSGPDTMFRHVHELEPGHYLVRSLGSAAPRTTTYWNILDHAHDTTDAETIAREFSDKLYQAISSRRLSDVPIGILLSGGIDSSSLTETLLRETPEAQFSLFFADNANAAFSERDDVEMFLDHMELAYDSARLDFRPAMVDYNSYTAQLHKLAWHYDEPIQFFNSPLLLGLCADAKRTGVKVLLSGEGSDELFFGYDRFERTRKELQGCGKRETILENLYFGGGLDNAPIIGELTKGVAGGYRETAAWNWLEATLDDHDLNRLQLLYSQRHRLQMLMQRQDRTGMANSVEIRVPFLAPWLVEWVNGLPISTLYDEKTGTTKRLLRNEMATRLPERILTKKKDGFPSDMMDWLRQEHMKRAVEEMIFDRSGFCLNYLDVDTLKPILADHFNGRIRRDYLIWNLYALELWHRMVTSYVSGNKVPVDQAATASLTIPT